MTKDKQKVTFDGKYLSYTDNSGNIVKIPAISGSTDYQNDDYQNICDKGSLPEGRYDVKQADYSSFADAEVWRKILSYVDVGTWNGSTMAWGEERVWLEPQSGNNMYGRDGFSIHGGDFAGSAGCIDLLNNASMFFNDFREFGACKMALQS